MTSDDLVIKYNTTWLAVAQEFAADKVGFHDHFASAWTKLMNADRFDGPLRNLCVGGGLSGVVSRVSDNNLVIG